MQADKKKSLSTTSAGFNLDSDGQDEEDIDVTLRTTNMSSASLPSKGKNKNKQDSVTNAGGGGGGRPPKPPPVSPLRGVRGVEDSDRGVSGSNGHSSGAVPMDDASGVSSLSNVSNLSALSETYFKYKSAVSSTVSHALQLLQGENPALVENDDDDDSSMGSVDGANEYMQKKMSATDRDLLGTITTTSSTVNVDGEAAEVLMYDDAMKQSNHFLDDEFCEMTYSRMLALFLMRRYKWYNPRLKVDGEEESEDNQDTSKTLIPKTPSFRTEDGYPREFSIREKPSLEKAWAYFEHVTLPRYCYRKKNKAKKNILVRAIRRVFCKKDQCLEMADPGDLEPTRLYRPIWTPHKQLGDWGLGFGLYFSNLRALTVLMLLALLTNIYTLDYYSGSDYSSFQNCLVYYLKGSAICTEIIWVPCPNCDDSGRKILAQNSVKLGHSYNPITNTSLTFGLKNDCEPTTGQAFANFVTMIVITLGMIIMGRYLDYMEVKFDEDEQTAQDYSIIVHNPPPDATDPEEWREFFEKNLCSKVAACTVAVNNDLLVRSLRERREKMKLLEMLVEPGTSMDMVTLAGIAAQVEMDRNWFDALKARMSPGIPEIFGRIAVLTGKVQGLAQQDYPVTNVFITFEREADQREVLSKLTVSRNQANIQQFSAVNNDINLLFRGNHLLYIEEPGEPNTIRWANLNAGILKKFKEQTLTGLATVLAIILVAIIVYYCNLVFGVTPGAFAIAGANSAFPIFAKKLVDLESHDREGSKQTSLYLKIAAFRWMNSAIIVCFITPFNSIIDFPFVTSIGEDNESLIDQISALYWAEIISSTFFQFGDFAAHYKRHWKAPRATTQDAMNINMQGTEVELAERYTNMTKIVFLTLFYSSIYPVSFLWGFCALFVNYFLDRFSLMRTWKRAPKFSSQISRFSRRYFLPIALVAMVTASSYFWSGFPFDNLCEGEAPGVLPDYNRDDYIGFWEIDLQEVPRDQKWNNFLNSLKEDATSSLNSATSSVTSMTGTTGLIENRYMNYTQNFFQQNNQKVEEEQCSKLELPKWVEVKESAAMYHYCLQDFLPFRGKFRFPFLPRYQEEGSVWMTQDQEFVANMFGGLNVLVIIAVVVYLLLGWIRDVMQLMRKTYKPSGEDQGIDFSTVPSINVYVPQVESSVYSFPLLAANVGHINREFLDWNDSVRPHAFYDLTKDAEVLVKNIDISSKIVFSQIKTWGPDDEFSTKK